MRTVLGLAGAMVIILAGCGRNEPGTMGGEPGVPETVATGAPAQAAETGSMTDSHQPAIESEHASSSFDDLATTNADPAKLPNASTLTNAPIAPGLEE